MNSKAKRIVDKINERNRKKYGEICPECDSFETFCRCDSRKIFKSKYDRLKNSCIHPEEYIRNFDSGASQCTLCRQMF
jgi:hypothetical protein